MEPLDEFCLRRPSYQGGTAVVLADGQEWNLPRPRIRRVYADNDDGYTLQLVDGPADDGTFERLRQALVGEMTNGEAWRAEMAMARHMLGVNYDLTPVQLGTLIQFSHDDDDDKEGERIRSDVLGVAFGRAPKGPPPDTSGPPSSPTE